MPRPILPPRSRDQDREKLYAKIREDYEQEQRVLAKPRIFGGPSTSTTTTTKMPQFLNQGQNPMHIQMVSPSHSHGQHQHESSSPLINLHHHSLRFNHDFPAGSSYFHRSNLTRPVVVGGEDPDALVRARRNFIRKVSLLCIFRVFLALKGNWCT